MKTKFDVFLSRKTEDAQLADKIYEYLTGQGLKVFDAGHSLMEIGNSNYSEAIDEALEGTSHLIVIGSSVENISSEWVKSEWRFFLNRKRSGKKMGNIFSVITNDMVIDDLPASLHNYEVIFFETGFDKLIHYLGGSKPVDPMVSLKDKKDMEELLPKDRINLGLLDFEKGKALYDHKKYGEAYYYLQKSAEQGNPSGKNLLGLMYNDGNYLNQDYYKAMNWYEKAAEQGYAPAQNNIGILYHNGHGGTQDYKTAMLWYEKAADQGFAAAQNNIGVLYYHGHGVTQDYKTAMQW